MGPLSTKIETTEDFAACRQQSIEQYEKNNCYIAVCGDTGCSVQGSKSLFDQLEAYLQKKGYSERIKLKCTGCLGLCESGPLMIVYPQEIFYQKVEPEDLEEIIEKTVLQGEIIDRLLYQDPVSGEEYVYARDLPFYEKQLRNLLEDNWKIDPNRVEDYVAIGGYSALVKAVTEMTPAAVIEEIKKSRLRGRGGAGFHTWIKWQECQEQTGRKFIICNADEGDPGAFMDRSLMEGNPHSVLEGLIIGGYAAGAQEGIVYIRAEYPSAVEKIKLAISKAEELGFIGENILGSDFSFQVYLSIGAGAFICGETSALIASVDGRIGEPVQKPPRLVKNGYLGRPTVVNNVESFANVPLIIRQGAEEYCRVGTEKSSGTKIFSLVGKVNNTGLVEVPLGITLREIIYDIGGGIKEGKKFKAVQTGGPSGGCLPASSLDLPTDFDELSAVGSMIGSGGMIVMDEETCMVDIARYFLQFLADESCGCCFTCREGISRLLEIVEGITKGRGSLEQLELLKELAEVVKDSTLCGLGQTAPNPVLSTLKHFEEEYRAHIEQKQCPAGVCRELITFSIDERLCNGCGLCYKNCPAGAVEGEKNQPHKIISDKCDKCGICASVCKAGAIIKQ
ncbi:MAG: NADH-ubiquinone oxidoreductase-F iron-sulfur binding region domain-containing protein [Bacillota bacterium]